MTKKDYIAIAWALRYGREAAETKVAAAMDSPIKPDAEELTALVIESVRIQLTNVMAKDNARFNVEIFNHFVNSKCLVCGGPIETTDSNTCRTCYAGRNK